jgi:hypothetical protein
VEVAHAREAPLSPLGIEVVGDRPGTRREQDEGPHPLRVGGGEGDADRSALGEAEEVGLGDAGRVHHRDEILHPLVDRRHVRGPVRRSRAPLVEVEDVGEPAEAGEERPVLGPLPRELDVLGEGRGHHQLGGTLSPGLEGEGGAVDAREADGSGVDAWHGPSFASPAFGDPLDGRSKGGHRTLPP